MTDSTAPSSLRRYVSLIFIGALAGVFSGLFGVGGGTVIVPLLVLLLGFGQRLAVGTSLAAIIPVAIVGAITYGIGGHISIPAAALLAAGSIVGAWVGAKLLHRLNVILLKWLFVAFMLVAMVMMFFVIPSRDAPLEITWVTALALVLVGLFTGVLAGLIGIGGGVVVVPVMMLGFGASDLIAKGTSLLMMVPTTISGTVANVRAKNVDLVAATVIGVTACVSVQLGVWLAAYVDPFVGNMLFAAFLLFIAAQMAIRTWRQQRSGR